MKPASRLLKRSIQRAALLAALVLALLWVAGDARQVNWVAALGRSAFTIEVAAPGEVLEKVVIHSQPELAGTPVKVMVFGPSGSAAALAGREPAYWNLAGVQISWMPESDQEIEMALAAASGAHSIGMDFEWKKIQREPGRYDWGATDAVVRLAKKYNLQIVPMLLYTPEWASTAPYAPLDFYRAPPRQARLYRDFVYQVVQRYKPGGKLPDTQDGYGIRDWVIWNEPNVLPAGQDPFPFHFWYGSLESYIELLRAGYEGAHAADPRANVLNAGLADVHWKPGEADLLTALERFYDPNGDGLTQDGGRPFFDTLNLHMYPASTPDEKWYQDRMDAILRIMERFGDSDKKIWVTETGYGSSRELQPGQAPAASGLPLLSEKDQAGAVELAYTALSGYPQVERVFWWSLRDYFVNQSDENQAMEGHYGLVSADFRPKPAYLTYMKLAARMDLLETQVMALGPSGRTEVSFAPETGRQPGTYLVWVVPDSAPETAFILPGYRAAAALLRIGLAEK